MFHPGKSRAARRVLLRGRYPAKECFDAWRGKVAPHCTPIFSRCCTASRLLRKACAPYVLPREKQCCAKGSFAGTLPHKRMLRPVAQQSRATLRACMFHPGKNSAARRVLLRGRYPAKECFDAWRGKAAPHSFLRLLYQKKIRITTVMSTKLGKNEEKTCIISLQRLQ